jgi:hypothetical protein
LRAEKKNKEHDVDLLDRLNQTLKSRTTQIVVA